MRKFQYGCGVIAQNFLLNYFLFKITLNTSKKVECPSEKPKDMSDDGTIMTVESGRSFLALVEDWGGHF